MARHTTGLVPGHGYKSPVAAIMAAFRFIVATYERHQLTQYEVGGVIWKNLENNMYYHSEIVEAITGEEHRLDLSKVVMCDPGRSEQPPPGPYMFWGGFHTHFPKPGYDPYRASPHDKAWPKSGYYNAFLPFSEAGTAIWSRLKILFPEAGHPLGPW